jgi:rRNA-processing protein FCF1
MCSIAGIRVNKMLKIILDTNFLIYCAENKIDYQQEIGSLVGESYELIVPKQVVDELEEIYKNGKKFSDRNAAWLAIKLLEHNKVSVVTVRASYADEAIISLVRIGSVVATLDLELRKKLAGTRIIVIQGVKKLAFD